MRQVLHLLVFLVAFCLLAACDETDIGSMDSERVAVKFSSGTNPSAKVSLDGDSWEIDDPIGIFMVENGQQLSDGTIAEGAKNVLYSCSESNTSANFNPVGSIIYYPQDGRSVDFIAYYPYISDISTGYLYPVNLLEQTSRHMDIMYSNNAEGLHKDSTWVNLKFSHVLSKLSFGLTQGEGSPDLSNAEIKVSNIDREAELKLVNGELINYRARGNSIATPNKSLFVLPRQAQTKKLIITLPNEDNNTFEWDFPASKQFEAGYHYTYDITVSKTGIQVSEADIVDWDGKDDTPVEAVVGKYKVGDYYPDPDVNLNDLMERAEIQGVVFWLDPDNPAHGKILSLDEVDGLSWSHHYGDHGAADQDKGIKNMYDIAQYIKNTSYGWNDFPAFNWVYSKNVPNEDYSNPDAKGIWYLPAQSELSDLAAAYNNYGQSAFNIWLTNAGGTAIQSGWYWGSTAYDMNTAAIHDLSAGISSTGTKPASFRARCILAF